MHVDSDDLPWPQLDVTEARLQHQQKHKEPRQNEINNDEARQDSGTSIRCTASKRFLARRRRDKAWPKDALPSLSNIDRHEHDLDEQPSVPLSSGPVQKLHKPASNHWVGTPLDFVIPNQHFDRLITHSTFNHVRVRKQRRMFVRDISSTESEVELAESWFKPTRKHLNSVEPPESPGPTIVSLEEPPKPRNRPPTWEAESWQLLQRQNDPATPMYRDFAWNSLLAHNEPREISEDMLSPSVSHNHSRLARNRLLSQPLTNSRLDLHEDLHVRPHTQRTVSAPIVHGTQGVDDMPTSVSRVGRALHSDQPNWRTSDGRPHLLQDTPRSISVDVSSSGRPRITTSSITTCIPTTRPLLLRRRAEQGDIFELRNYHEQQYALAGSLFSASSSPSESVSLDSPSVVRQSDQVPLYDSMHRRPRAQKGSKMTNPLLSPVLELNEPWPWLEPFHVAGEPSVWLDIMRHQRLKGLSSISDLTLITASAKPSETSSDNYFSRGLTTSAATTFAQSEDCSSWYTSRWAAEHPYDVGRNITRDDSGHDDDASTRTLPGSNFGIDKDDETSDDALCKSPPGVLYSLSGSHGLPSSPNPDTPPIQHRYHSHQPRRLPPSRGNRISHRMSHHAPYNDRVPSPHPRRSHHQPQSCTDSPAPRLGSPPMQPQAPDHVADSRRRTKRESWNVFHEQRTWSAGTGHVAGSRKPGLTGFRGQVVHESR